MSMLMVLKFRLHLFLDKRGLNGWNSSKLRLSKPRWTHSTKSNLSLCIKTEPVTAEAEETVYSVQTYCTVRKFIWWLYCLALCDEMFDPFPLFDETWRNPPNLWLRNQTYRIPLKRNLLLHVGKSRNRTFGFRFSKVNYLAESLLKEKSMCTLVAVNKLVFKPSLTAIIIFNVSLIPP